MRNLIKKKMIDLGRDDFVNYTAEILECTRQTASNKLSGLSKFNEDEIKVLALKLSITSEELSEIIVKD